MFTDSSLLVSAMHRPYAPNSAINRDIGRVAHFFGLSSAQAQPPQNELHGRECACVTMNLSMLWYRFSCKFHAPECTLHKIQLSFWGKAYIDLHFASG